MRNSIDWTVTNIAGGPVQRRVLFDGLVCDHNTSSVSASISHSAFYSFGGIDQVLEIWCIIVELLEIRGVFQGFLDAHRRQIGNGFCDPVNFLKGDVHYPPHIPDGSPGFHGAKGDDLGYLVVAILFSAVVHHLRAPVIGEIQIDIGHRDPAGV